jgi:hypothetical protein
MCSAHSDQIQQDENVCLSVYQTKSNPFLDPDPADMNSRLEVLTLAASSGLDVTRHSETVVLQQYYCSRTLEC